MIDALGHPLIFAVLRLESPTLGWAGLELRFDRQRARRDGAGEFCAFDLLADDAGLQSRGGVGHHRASAFIAGPRDGGEEYSVLLK